MRQKIVISGSNLAVAWAGRLSTAKDILSKLCEAHEASPFTRNTLEEYLTAISASVWQEISLIGSFWHDQNMTYNFWPGSDAVALPSARFKRIVTAGSGAKAFHWAMNKLVFPSEIDETAKKFFPLITAISAAGLFMSAELSSPDHTVGQSFGGGYEAAVLTESGYEKPPAVTYVFWTLTVDKNVKVQSLSLKQVLRFWYEGDWLLIRPLVDAGDKGVMQNSLYALSSLHKSTTSLVPSDLITRPFISKSQFVAHVGTIVGSDNLGPAFLIEAINESSEYITIDELPESYHIRINSELGSRFTHDIQALLKS